MEYSVPHPLFRHQHLTVRPASAFRGASLLLNGKPVKRSMGKYLVKNDVGDAITVRLRANFIDPMPSVKIGTEVVLLAPALKWYEYAWIGVPALLVFIGGALGAGIGVAAAYSNSRVFRSDRAIGAKYFLTGLTTIGALAAFLVVAVLIQIAVHSPKQ